MEIKSTKTVSSERVVALIVGPSGIGKTSLARTLPESDTLIISAESGLLCLAGTNYDVAEIKTMSELKEVFLYLMEEKTKKKYKNIFIDSLTELGEVLLSELKNSKEFADPKMALKMYGQYNDDFTEFVKAVRDLKPYSIFFTCLNAFEKDGMQLVEEFNFPGAKVKANIKAWFDLVLKYEVFDNEGKKFRMLISDMSINPLSKDRSGKLDAYENANLSDIKEKILKWNHSSESLDTKSKNS